MDRFVLVNCGIGLDYPVDWLAGGLADLGYEVSATQGQSDYNAINILFAGFLLNWRHLVKSAPRSINFNLELIARSDRLALRPGYFALMKHLANWDFSDDNAAALSRAGIPEVSVVPFGYSKCVDRIPTASKDIDVLFYGSHSERRLALIRALIARGLKVVWTENRFWTPPERDELISRSKVVLEVPYYDTPHHISEARVCYLMCNRVPVVAEMYPHTMVAPDVRESVVGAPMNELVETCVELCRDSRRLSRVAEAGFARIKQRDWLPHLEAALARFRLRGDEHASGDPIITRCAMPDEVRVCASGDWDFSALNVGPAATSGVDLVADFSKPLPFGQEFRSWRFGEAVLTPGSIRKITAVHALAFAEDIDEWMGNALQWLMTGGVLVITEHHEFSVASRAHPGIRHRFNERSFDRYGGDGLAGPWREARFDVEKVEFEPSAYGNELTAGGADLATILRTPRALETLTATLVKRHVSDAERERDALASLNLFS